MPDRAEISFLEHLAPSLRAGAYEVHVTTTVAGAPGLPRESISEASELIHVGGERFRLNPADVDSIYPPYNGEGFFEETLPHIVFRRAGIPWERQPFARDTLHAVEDTKVTTVGRASRATWLALLLFDEDDPAPTLKQVRIRDLLATAVPRGVWFPTEFRPEPGEDPDSTCMVIDISRSLFDELKPTTADLVYLAHARKVDVTFKPGSQGEQHDSEQEYSVVIGSRLPRTGKESVVHLVSLEGYAPILDGDEHDDHHTVRLVSLRSWRFSCADSGGSLREHFEALNGGVSDGQGVNDDNPILLHRPIDEGNPISEQTRRLFQLGYVPMEHKFRMGSRSISWYRGPLAPLSVEPVLSPPFSSADALLIYDPRLGYYDVSYAAAWQLGQLLALRNRRFARAQYFWKQQATVDARKRMEQRTLGNRLPALPHEEGGATHLESVLDQVADANQKGELKQSGSLHDDSESLDYSPDLASEWYATIQDYVDALKALRDVPYNYLVPESGILPADSLRFFHVDPNWVAALVDGAFSIGDIVKQDADRKKALLGHDAMASQWKPVKYSGFILRSSIMRVWPGIEVRSFENNSDRPLKIVRNERIAEDVLLCVVEGTIAAIELSEPPEALHFGVSSPRAIGSDGVTRFEKEIRNLANEQNLPKVQDLRTSGRRVIAMATLAETIQSQAGVSVVFGDRFTAADFGYVMVQPVAAVRLTLSEKVV